EVVGARTEPLGDRLLAYADALLDEAVVLRLEVESGSEDIGAGHSRSSSHRLSSSALSPGAQSCPRRPGCEMPAPLRSFPRCVVRLNGGVGGMQHPDVGTSLTSRA